MNEIEKKWMELLTDMSAALQGGEVLLDFEDQPRIQGVISSMMAIVLNEMRLVVVNKKVSKIIDKYTNQTTQDDKDVTA